MKKFHIFSGFDKVAELLIQNGADTNIVGLLGENALIYAAEKGKSYTIPITQSTIYTTSEIFVGREDISHTVNWKNI